MSSPKPKHKDTQTGASAAPAARAALLTQVDAALRPLADPVQAVPMRAYMLDQFAFWGIRATPRRQALRGLPRLNTWTAADLLSVAEALWDLPEREFQYVAVDLLAKHHGQLGMESLPRLLQLVQRHAWWDTVDGLAGVVGDILLRARTGQADAQRPMDAWLVGAPRGHAAPAGLESADRPGALVSLCAGLGARHRFLHPQSHWLGTARPRPYPARGGAHFFGGSWARFFRLDAAGGRQTFGVMGGWAALRGLCRPLKPSAKSALSSRSSCRPYFGPGQFVRRRPSPGQSRWF